MRKIVLGSGLILALSLVCPAQDDTKRNPSPPNKKSTSAERSNGNAGLQAGTQIVAELQSTLDVKKAEIGDQVVLKTTKAIKQNGQTVVEKGSRLIGRVTEVQQKTRDNAASRLTVVFDQLQNGSLTAPISASIVSITEARSAARIDDTIDSDLGATSTTRTSSSGNSSGGGLLGGVGSTIGNTVGGVVNTTTNTVGSVANTAGSAVGGATNAVGRTLSGIQISQSADASAEGGSTLSLTKGNLRLEKGATFLLRLNESASAGNEDR